jgi:hypothetical protein
VAWAIAAENCDLNQRISAELAIRSSSQKGCGNLRVRHSSVLAIAVDARLANARSATAAEYALT